VHIVYKRNVHIGKEDMYKKNVHIVYVQGGCWHSGN